MNLDHKLEAKMFKLLLGHFCVQLLYCMTSAPCLYTCDSCWFPIWFHFVYSNQTAMYFSPLSSSEKIIISFPPFKHYCFKPKPLYLTDNTTALRSFMLLLVNMWQTHLTSAQQAFPLFERCLVLWLLQKNQLKLNHFLRGSSWFEIFSGCCNF